MNEHVAQAKQVEFFFDFGSPASYLAWTQLPTLAATGAQVLLRPMLLGGVFKATGNVSPVTLPAKARWLFADLALWARRYRVELKFSRFFPLNTLALMRGAVGLQMQQPERLPAYNKAIFEAVWQHERNLGDAAVLAATLAEAGFDAAAFSALVAEPEVKAALIANTEEAVSRGVFGAPSFFVGEQLFFGQDRLDFVRDALR